jgi:hypothetical protein
VYFPFRFSCYDPDLTENAFKEITRVKTARTGAIAFIFNKFLIVSWFYRVKVTQELTYFQYPGYPE